MEKGYSLAEATSIVAKQCGEKSISSEFVSRCLRAMRKISKLCPSDRFTIQEVSLVSIYASETHRHHKRPPILEWVAAHNFPIPKPIALCSPKKTATKNTMKPEQTVTLREVQRLINKAFDEKIGALKKKGASQLLLIGPEKATRDNDPRILEIHKKIERFVHEEPATVKQVWTHCKNAFEDHNGIKVLLAPGQSLPQWLRHENYLDVFLVELQGILDELHDSLTPKASA